MAVPEQGLCGRTGRREGRGCQNNTLKKCVPFINFSFLCKLEFWKKLLSMIDKVSKSLQSKNMYTSTAARKIVGIKVIDVKNVDPKNKKNVNKRVLYEKNKNVKNR